MWIIVGILAAAIAIFSGGFLVGHRWGDRVFKAKDSLKDTLGKV